MGKSYQQIFLSALFVFMLLFCAAGAHEAYAISFTGSVKDSAGHDISGITIEMVGNSSISTTSVVNGSFTLNGLPSGTPFSLKISMSGFIPVYTASMNSTANIASPWNYVLHDSSEVSSWGVSSGKGVIASRVSNNANPSENVGGAVVSCTSTKYPGACPYTIKYNDGSNVIDGPSTYDNGKYYVMNVDDNDTVYVTATKSGWFFPIKPFITHANAVSEGRINGTLITSPTISGTVTYKGSRPGTLYVGLFNSPVITPGQEGPAYVTQINNPSVYSAYMIPNVADGTYYVGAIKTNSTDVIQKEDPYGMYGAPTSVVISGGTPVTGINFTIVDGTALHPNPFYFSWDTLDISCPASVNVGSPLTVTVALYNWDCDNSLNVARFMMSVVGNADGTLSGLGIFGPYNRSLSTPKVVPPASCGATTTPGTVTPFNLTAMNTVPASLSGKMALVMIDAMSATGQSLSGKECMIQVP